MYYRILEFCDGTIGSFNGNYDAYRKNKIEGQTLKQVEKSKRNTAVNKNLNRSDESKISNRFNRSDRNETDHTEYSRQLGQQTKKKPDIKQTEARIIQLEEKRKELENTFGMDTPPEKYIEYDELIKEIEDLYELYVENNNTE